MTPREVKPVVTCMICEELYRREYIAGKEGALKAQGFVGILISGMPCISASLEAVNSCGALAAQGQIEFRGGYPFPR